MKRNPNLSVFISATDVLPTSVFDDIFIAVMKMLYSNITYRCDCRCVFCAADNGINRYNTDVPLEKLEEALEKLGIGPGDEVIINGGEPTMHPQFPEIIRVCRNRNPRIVLFTNGNYFSIAKEKDVISHIEGVDQIEVPIYTLDPELDEKLTRRKGNLKSRLEGIKALADASREKQYQLKIKMLLLKSNENDLYEIFDGTLKLLKHFDMAAISFPIYSHAMFKRFETLSPDIDSLGRKISDSIIFLIEHGILLKLLRIPLCLLPVSVAEIYVKQLTGNPILVPGFKYAYLDPVKFITDIDLSDAPYYNCRCDFKPECKFGESCCGVPVDYINIFGWPDCVNPIRSDFLR